MRCMCVCVCVCGVCVFANFISKIVLVPKYPLAQLRVLLFMLLVCCRLLEPRTLCSAPSPRWTDRPTDRAQELINKVLANAMTVRRRWATTIPKATEQKTLQVQSQSQSQLQYNFALIMHTKYAKYPNR